MTKTSIRRFSAIRKCRNGSMKTKFGLFLFRWLELLMFCIQRKYCIENWNQPTFFSQKSLMPNSGISTCLKLLNKVFYTLRQVRLTMPVPRCGKTNHTTTRVIFGHLVVCFISCLQVSCHLKEQTNKNLKLNSWTALGKFHQMWSCLMTALIFWIHVWNSMQLKE